MSIVYFAYPSFYSYFQNEKIVAFSAPPQKEVGNLKTPKNSCCASREAIKLKPNLVPSFCLTLFLHKLFKNSSLNSYRKTAITIEAIKANKEGYCLQIDRKFAFSCVKEDYMLRVDFQNRTALLPNFDVKQSTMKGFQVEFWLNIVRDLSMLVVEHF